MAKSQLQTVVRKVRHLAAIPHAMDQADADLLHAFVSDNDQPAFAELVRRHAPMVLSVCHRVLHHTQDAEDAFQATFIVLARRAGSIRKTDALASWLHGVAHHMATKAQRAASRRRAYENRSAAAQPPNPVWSAAWREVQAVLDEEIECLPDTYRLPFVMCCLENCSCTEVARQLGLREGTVRSRVARARKKLQKRLLLRGVSLTTVLGACALSGNTALSAVPPLLISSAIRTATQVAMAPGAITHLVSPGVATLLHGANRVIGFNKLKATALLVATLVVGVAWTVMAADKATSGPSGSGLETTPVQPDETPPTKPDASVEEKGDAVRVRGRVLDPDGKPLQGAKLYVWVDYNYMKPVPSTVRAMTGPDGHFDFTFAKQDIAEVGQWTANSTPEPWRHAVIVAAAPGYGGTWSKIAQSQMVNSPRVEKGELVLRLVKDDVPVRGRVRDLEGRPVAGATVQVKNIDLLYGCLWEGLSEKVTTGEDGWFILTGIGRGRTATLRIAAPTIQMQMVGVNTSAAASATVDLIAEPTKPIEGVVRARDTGKPLAGVVIFGKYERFGDWNDDPFGMVRTVTDAEGHYRLVGLPKASQYEIQVCPRDDQSYLEMIKWIGGTEGLKPISLDFSLRRGVTVRFRAIDKLTHKPVRGIAQYTPARSNPLWGEATAPYGKEMLLPRFFVPGHVPDKDGFFQFVVYPGHGVIFVNVGEKDQYMGGRLDPEDEKKGYYPLGKGEPNNGFVGSNAYRVVDTDKTDEPLKFDLEVTPHPPAPVRGK